MNRALAGYACVLALSCTAIPAGNETAMSERRSTREEAGAGETAETQADSGGMERAGSRSNAMPAANSGANAVPTIDAGTSRGRCPAGACFPGGVCNPNATGFTCDCDHGFEGTGTMNCVNPDDCPSNACTPGGSCVDGLDDYSCKCESGFSGTGTRNCANVDECHPDACGAWGKCIDKLNDYECMCDWPNPKDKKRCPFRDDGDSVYDSRTGQSWQKSHRVVPPAEQNDVKSNRAYCENLTLEGTTWRLPALIEAQAMEDIMGPGCYAVWDFQAPNDQPASYCCTCSPSAERQIRCIQI
jgi:hypothetical protein